ncbi:hypothetical protein ACJX0J_035810, partial [Zea mays]
SNILAYNFSLYLKINGFLDFIQNAKVLCYNYFFNLTFSVIIAFLLNYLGSSMQKKKNPAFLDARYTELFLLELQGYCFQFIVSTDTVPVTDGQLYMCREANNKTFCRVGTLFIPLKILVLTSPRSVFGARFVSERLLAATPP